MLSRNELNGAQFNCLLRVFVLFIKGLNMFLVPQVLAKFEISFSSKFLTNLVFYLSKCMNLVLLTKIC